MRRIKFAGIISVCFLLFLNGCASVSSIDVDELTLKAPEGIVLPLDESLDVYLPPDISSRIVNHNGMNANEGALLKRSAMDTFPKVFSEVNLVSDPSGKYLATVKEVSSNVSSFSGVHSVSMKVEFNQLDGEEIGSFTGKGSVLSGLVFENTALANAFIEAYMDVLQQLVKSEQFVNLIANSPD